MFYLSFQFSKVKSMDGRRMVFLDILAQFIQFLLFYLIYLITFMKYNHIVIIVVEFTFLTRIHIAMKAQIFQHTFEVDQERKILQQIHDINKKLSAQSHSAKNPPLRISLLKAQQDAEQKYFSQQCDDLFAEQNFPKAQLDNPLDESLFNSNNSLLLGNQFEKQVRNFPQFSTNQLLGQKNYGVNDSKSFHLNEPKQSNGYNSRSIQGRKSESVGQNNTNKFQSNKNMQKNTSQASLSKKNEPISCKNKINKRVNCDPKSLNKLIEDKENIQSYLNILKKPFIKQIKSKIRFETQPDEHQLQNQYFESFQIRQLQNNSKNLESVIEKASKHINKPNHQKHQCTFKPSILKKSNDIAENLQPSFERLTQDIIISKSQSKLPYKAKQQFTQKKYSIKRLQQLSQPRKQKEPTEKEELNYDFRPTLSKKSLSQMANCTMDVASRNKLWLEQKQAKILKLKEEEQEKKLKKQGGPFAPKITPYKGQNQVHLSRFTKQGISSYFERVSMAKQKTEVIDKKKPTAKEQVKQVVAYMKKKTYDEAVKDLHKKILTMNI